MRTGYRFEGWWTTAEAGGTRIRQITESGDIVLYARWTRIGGGEGVDGLGVWWWFAIGAGGGVIVWIALWFAVCF